MLSFSKYYIKYVRSRGMSKNLLNRMDNDNFVQIYAHNVLNSSPLPSHTQTHT